jgi:hypothetical protein
MVMPTDTPPRCNGVGCFVKFQSAAYAARARGNTQGLTAIGACPGWAKAIPD